MKTMIYLSSLLIGLQFHSYHFTGLHDVQECRTGVAVWRKIVPVNTDFAFRLYKEVSSKLDDSNILLCPVCMSTALAMLSLGAQSETQSQIYRGLGFNVSEIEETEIHEAFSQLTRMLNLSKRKMHVKIGNALFLEKSLEVLPTFLEGIKKSYHAEVFSTDFQNSTGATQQINDYVNNKTNGKIVSGVKDLRQDTQMVLVDYIFFKGSWKHRFHHKSTTERDFLVHGDTTTELNMMYKRGRYRFLHDKNLSCLVVEVPYSKGRVAWFILPDEGKLKKVERSLVKEDLEKWKTSFEYRELELRIPKFSISASYDVKNVLQRLGIRDVFNHHADLSGISAKQHLKVSQALHEAVLLVQEVSTTMAQAGYPGLLSSWMSPSPPLIVFNRPFMFAFYDSTSDSILLMGKTMPLVEI